MILFFFCFFGIFSFSKSCTSLDSNSKCSGCPPTYNGLPCASTTRYVGSGSACGCFSSFHQNTYTAAPNEAFWVRNTETDLTWCGRRCGECYEIKTTGGWIHLQADPNPTPDVSIIIQIVDVCPVLTNEVWCGQGKDPISCERDGDCESHTNDYGYLTHFDLHNDAGQVYPGLNWDNVEVTYERVQCPEAWTWQNCSDCYGDTQPYAFDEWRYNSGGCSYNVICSFVFVLVLSIFILFS